ncbi:MAG: hypothetical protein ABF876_18990 [Acetobacter aceti]|uniref:hypothetical protein n=1 Tax=Acetobacter aceti TaxID=435 RepID=UPI0011EA53AB|nr:hypothetical protein [Acetobacter aceti]
MVEPVHFLRERPHHLGHAVGRHQPVFQTCQNPRLDPLARDRAVVGAGAPAVVVQTAEPAVDDQAQPMPSFLARNPVDFRSKRGMAYFMVSYAALCYRIVVISELFHVFDHE